MSSPIQQKTDHLAAALAPHLGPASTRTLKGVAQSLRHLAKQLTNQQAKQEKAAAKAALPTAKKQRNTMAHELLTALHPHLGLGKDAESEVPKKVARTVKQLATQLLKQRAKLTRQTAKAVRKAVKKTAAAKSAAKPAAKPAAMPIEKTAATPTAKPTITPASPRRAARPQPMTATRKPATAKIAGPARGAEVPENGIAK